MTGGPALRKICLPTKAHPFNTDCLGACNKREKESEVFSIDGRPWMDLMDQRRFHAPPHCQPCGPLHPFAHPLLLLPCPQALAQSKTRVCWLPLPSKVSQIVIEAGAAQCRWISTQHDPRHWHRAIPWAFWHANWVAYWSAAQCMTSCSATGISPLDTQGLGPYTLRQT